jgi:hypothetical protein
MPHMCMQPEPGQNPVECLVFLPVTLFQEQEEHTGIAGMIKVCERGVGGRRGGGATFNSIPDEEGGGGGRCHAGVGVTLGTVVFS